MKASIKKYNNSLQSQKGFAGEEWRDVVGYEGLYEVSNLGRVKSLERVVIRKNGRPYTVLERIRECVLDNKGYCLVKLHKYGVKTTYKVHRLVAALFIANPYNKEQVDHIDGNKCNNSAANLRWCTNKENCNYPNIRRAKHYNVATKGKYHHLARPIIGINTKNCALIQYDYIQQSRQDGFNPQLISLCLNNHPHHLTHKGFKWIYAQQKNKNQ